MSKISEVYDNIQLSDGDFDIKVTARRDQLLAERREINKELRELNRELEIYNIGKYFMEKSRVPYSDNPFNDVPF